MGQEIIDKEEKWNEIIGNFITSPGFRTFVTMMRIITAIFLVFITYIMWTNIEEVKLLASDPCKICENKTGAECLVYQGIPQDNNFTLFNFSDEVINENPG